MMSGFLRQKGKITSMEAKVIGELSPADQKKPQCHFLKVEYSEINNLILGISIPSDNLEYFKEN